jgi:hypothetical protein
LTRYFHLLTAVLVMHCSSHTFPYAVRHGSSHHHCEDRRHDQAWQGGIWARGVTICHFTIYGYHFLCDTLMLL